MQMQAQAQAQAQARRARQAGGFTLVELMIVVVIVGILATLAVVGYRKILNSSKVAEATNMVQAIRVAQESYHAETGSYARISSTLSDMTCPAMSTGQAATWDPTCKGSSGLAWSTLPVHSDGALKFQYATVGGNASDALPAAPTGMLTTPTFGSGVTSDWFAVSAKGDVDANGVFCTVVTTSWNSSVFVDRPGE